MRKPAGARKNLDWPYEPFVVPEPILAEWRKVSARGAAARAQWRTRLNASDQRVAFSAHVCDETPPEIGEFVRTVLDPAIDDPHPCAACSPLRVRTGSPSGCDAGQLLIRSGAVIGFATEPYGYRAVEGKV